MKLTIKTLKGVKFGVEVPDTLTIKDVKAQIQSEKADMPADCMKLIMKGKILDDTVIVSSLGFTDADFIVCMIAKPKKAKAVAATPATPAASTSSATGTTSSTTPASAVLASSQSSSSAPAAAAVQPTPAAASAAAAAAVASVPALDAGAIAQLVAMGFPESQASAALTAAGGNANVAIEFLMNGIPDEALAAAGAGNGSSANPAVGGESAAAAAAGGAAPVAPGGSTLAALRAHPQFDQLRQMVQSNPATLQAVLTQIGSQNPDLLTLINSNQEEFVAMMNEPIVAAPAPAVPAAGGGGAAPANPLGGLGGMLGALGGGGGGANGQPNAAQMAQIFAQMPAEQRDSIAQMIGISPEQLAGVSQLISGMSQEELAGMMAEGGAGGGMADMMGAMGGAGAGGGGMGNAAQGQHVIRLTPDEMAAVDRLTEMGFDRNEAAQAFLACDKNEALAANFLMDSMSGGGGDMYG